MKKLFVLLLCAGFFTACEKETLGYEFEKTNLSAIEVLCSAELWRGVDITYYTEPDAKGNKHYFGDPGSYDGAPYPLYSFTSDVITIYSNIMAIPISYYRESALVKIDDSLYHYDDGETYIKILDYDEENVLIETNRFKTIHNDVEYPYSTILLDKPESLSPKWKDNYLTYDEYLEFMEGRK